MTVTPQTATAPDVDSRRAGVPAPRGRRMGSAGMTLLLLVMPSVLLLVLINAYPFVYAAWQSMRNGTLISAGDSVVVRKVTREL